MKLSHLLVALGLSIALPLLQPSSAHAQYGSLRSVARDAETLTEEGMLAPDFRVKLLDGTSMTLGSQRGKFVVLNIFDTWCPYCRQLMPYLEWLNKRHRGANFAMLSVSREEPLPDVSNFWKANQYSFPAGLDPNGQISSLYFTSGVPRTYLISPSGHILFQGRGFGKDQVPYIDSVLDQLKRTPDARRAYAWRKRNVKALNALIKKPATTETGEDGKPTKAGKKAVYLMDERGRWRLN